MVVVKNLSTTVINSLPNYGGEILYNTTANRPIVNTVDGFKYFVLSSLTGEVSGLTSISATNLTGTLQTAAQPNVTSLGTLTGLASDGIVNISQHNGTTLGLQLAGTLVTATAEQLNYTNVTPGTATANKALVTDSNNSIAGLYSLETDHLTVNGTLVTASAIELNYTDVTTAGVAQASKALVLDENKDIVGIHNLETDNLTVNGTLVTASALELNYTDVSAIGTAQAVHALVTDSNNSIVSINHLGATTIDGLITTAAQPDITSVGTLTSLTVSGTTNLASLTVGGVPLTPYGTAGIRTRVYSTADFNGSIIWNEISDNVNFAAYAPAGQTTGYSMEIWGYIQPIYSEEYTFTVTSNANFRMWINNNLVKTGWTSGAHNNLQTNPIALTAGVWYPIYIQHVQLTDTEVLSLNWTSTSQISQIIPKARFAFDNKDVDVYIRNSYFQDVLSLYDSTNSNISNIAVTTSGDLNLSPYSNNVNITGHDGGEVGLELAGVLVTSTATQLNYTNVTPGTASATRALVVDSNKDIGSVRNIRTIGNLGINKSSADKQVEINSSTGDCLRLTYNTSSGTSSNYTDFLVSSSGNLTLTASGSSINMSNALNVTGATALSDTLAVTGATTLSSTLGVTGASTLSSTLGVTGATTLSSTLDVVGTITFDNVTDASSSIAGGCLTISGGAAVAKKLFVGDTLNAGNNLDVFNDATIGGNTSLVGTLGVTGASTLSSTLGVTGATTLSSTLAVTGTSTLSSTLGVTGATTLSDTLAVTGAATFSNTLSAAGNFSLNSTDDATSSTNGGSLTVSGGAAIAKKLFVGTSLSIGGNSSLAGTLGVTGAAILSDVLGVTGATTLSSTLGVTGATTLSSTLNVVGTIALDNTTDSTSSSSGGALTLAGGAAIAKKLFVGTDLSIGGNSSLMGTLGVIGATTLTGAASLSSTLDVTDATTLSSTLGVTGATTLSDILNVTGATTLSSSLSVSGVISLSNTNDATSSTNGGCLTISGGAAVAKKLFVGTNLSVGGNSSLAGTLGVTGASTLTGAVTAQNTLSVTGATALSSTLGVTGATSLSNTLEVTDAAVFHNNANVEGYMALTHNNTPAYALDLGANVALPAMAINLWDGQRGFGASASALNTFSDTAFKWWNTNSAQNGSNDSSPSGTNTMTLSSTGVLTLINGTASSSTTAGSIIMSGGISSSNTTDATSTSSGGGLTLAGGAAIAKKLFVGTDLSIGGNSSLAGTLGVIGAATLSSTLDVTGNAAFSGTFSVAGAFSLNSTDDATSSTAGGCLTLAGGAAVAKKLYVGTDLHIIGDSYLGGNLSVTGPVLKIPTGNTAARPSTPSAGNIRYNSETSQFEGYGPGDSWGSLGGVVNVQQTTKILAELSPASDDNNLRFINSGSESMRLTATGKLGVNTSDPSKQVEINAAAGDVLRLTYGDNNGSAVNYSDFNMSSNGNLTILSSGLTTFIDSTNNFDISGHNGSSLGLKLGGVLVTSTAEQINYNNVTAGTAAASKALILDSSRDIANINHISSSYLSTTFNDANTNTIGNPISLIRTTSASPAAGLGIGLEFHIQNSANNNTQFGNIEVTATTITSGIEDGQMVINLMRGGDSTAAMTLNNTTMMVTELVETSDRRVKENFAVVDNEDSFNKLMDLNIIDYNFIADPEKKTHRGLIAQELAEVIPDAVTICEKDGIEDFHAVSSKELVGYLISSLQFMNSKFEALSAKYEDLESKICKCNQ